MDTHVHGEAVVVRRLMLGYTSLLLSTGEPVFSTTGQRRLFHGISETCILR